MLTMCCVMTTITVHMGFGKHIWEVPPENSYPRGLMGNFIGFFAVLGLIYSKTSFSITLLRITEGWMKRLVWFILITVNLSLYAAAIFFWIRCSPLPRSWNLTNPGTCWPDVISNTYGIICGGKTTSLDI